MRKLNEDCKNMQAQIASLMDQLEGKSRELSAANERFRGWMADLRGELDSKAIDISIHSQQCEALQQSNEMLKSQLEFEIAQKCAALTAATALTETNTTLSKQLADADAEATAAAAAAEHAQRNAIDMELMESQLEVVQSREAISQLRDMIGELNQQLRFETHRARLAEASEAKLAAAEAVLVHEMTLLRAELAAREKGVRREEEALRLSSAHAEAQLLIERLEAELAVALEAREVVGTRLSQAESRLAEAEQRLADAALESSALIEGYDAHTHTLSFSHTHMHCTGWIYQSLHGIK